MFILIYLNRYKFNFVYLTGLDTASNVAQLINDAFKKNAREEKPKIEAGGIIANLLKLLSFDTSKIGAIVLNSIIFLAQMVNIQIY